MMNTGERKENQDKYKLYSKIKKMENKNQNEESKSNGMELLENVIKSNDNNIASNLENKESNAEVKANIEDLVLAIGQMQLDFEVVKEIPNEVSAFYEKEQLARNQHLTNIVTIIEAVISQKTSDYLESLQKTAKRMEKFILERNWSCNFHSFGVDYFNQFRNQLVQRKHQSKK